MTSVPNSSFLSSVFDVSGDWISDKGGATAYSGGSNEPLDFKKNNK